MTSVTQMLAQIEAGDSGAAARLLPIVYDELRRLAAHKLSYERPGLTLQATALVHEAYLRLVAGNDEPHWYSRGHFFGAAAEAMRRILVDRARQSRRIKHGGDLRRIEFDSAVEAVTQANIAELDRVLDVDAGLEKLAAESPIKAELVKLRFFAGLTIEEAATALGISRATADRFWAYAKVFLYSELHDQEEA